jgi:AcrR family transcriptional regulator
MVDNNLKKRRPGRPLAFDPDKALDQAVLVFWQHGYDGADTETLARAMGVTKPSIYGTFGTKEQLFLKVLHHYGATLGSDPIRAFAAAHEVQMGVSAFFAALVDHIVGVHGPTGCLNACVASQCAADMPSVAEFTLQSHAATDQAIAELLHRGIENGQLPKDFPVAERAVLMTDLMNGLALRARAGSSRAQLESAVSGAVAAILL